MKHRNFFWLMGMLLMVSNAGCADTTYKPDERVYHTFVLDVDRSVNKVNNLRYHYGAFGLRTALQEWPGSVADSTASIKVPDFF